MGRLDCDRYQESSAVSLIPSHSKLALTGMSETHSVSAIDVCVSDHSSPPGQPACSYGKDGK